MFECRLFYFTQIEVPYVFFVKLKLTDAIQTVEFESTDVPKEMGEKTNEKDVIVKIPIEVMRRII